MAQIPYYLPKDKADELEEILRRQFSSSLYRDLPQQQQQQAQATAVSIALAQERTRVAQERYWQEQYKALAQAQTPSPSIPEDFPIKFIPKSGSFRDFHEEMEREREKKPSSKTKWVLGIGFFSLGWLFWELIKWLFF